MKETLKRGDIVYPYMCTPEYQKANPIKINYLKTIESRIKDEEGNMIYSKNIFISDDGFSWYPQSTVTKTIEKDRNENST